jgi:hypothetical protein
MIIGLRSFVASESWFLRSIFRSTSVGSSVFSSLEGERRRRTENDEDRLLLFMEHLRADASVEEWQQDQAQRAVELYLNVYLKEGNRHQVQGLSGMAEDCGQRPKGGAVDGQHGQNAHATRLNDGAVPAKEDALSSFLRSAFSTPVLIGLDDRPFERRALRPTDVKMFTTALPIRLLAQYRPRR